ncbi:hypothetical protein EJD97_004367 [Solanum chilense]|uniref:CCHC-type domain-containing protein n=1 Tax=Solanum chilense TaxID=4083 RepID=A0A6N2CF83_SOLCI|nr:hypothetical protein EJD97_004367 [Solanum chilense]
MTTRKAATRRVEERISNAGVPPQRNHGPPQEQALLGDQDLVIPPYMMDGEIRTFFINLDQAMNTQAQSMAAQENWKVGLRMNQNASTMASCLRDFTRMNPPMLFGSKCNLTMLHNNMENSPLIVHDQQVEENRLQRNNIYAKRIRSYEGDTSKGTFEIQDKPKSKKRFSNQVPSNLPKACKDRVSNPRSQRGRGGDSPSDKPRCTKCGKEHMGGCLVGRENFFGCGKSGHKVRNCPVTKVRGRESN